MSASTPPAVLEGPVTQYTFAELLRQARAFLRDSSRDGQLLGMRIDEALKRYDEGFSFPIVCNAVFNEAELRAFDAARPDAILTASKPITFNEIPFAGEAPPDVRAFARAILHGSSQHKEWLLAAAEAFAAGNQLPEIAW